MFVNALMLSGFLSAGICGGKPSWHSFDVLGYSQARQLVVGSELGDVDGDGFVESLYRDGERGTSVEHVVPQSWLRRDLSAEGYSVSRRDMTHLWACDLESNQGRSNHAYGYCNDCFVPIDRSKGIVARSTLWVGWVYGVRIGSEEREILLRWSELYPVMAEERERNLRVAEVQGVGNWFVDDPSLIELCLGL